MEHFEEIERQTAELLEEAGIELKAETESTSYRDAN